MAPPKELPKGADGDAPVKKKSRFKFYMLLFSLILLLAGIGGGGYWWLYLRPDAKGFAGLFGGGDEAVQTSGTEASKEAQAGGDAKTAEASKDAKDAKSGEASKSGASSGPRPLVKPVPLPSFMVNLADPGGNRYLKLGMEVEVNNSAAIAEIESQTARIRDAVILLLSNKQTTDLSSAEGKITLKNEVAARLNQIIGNQRVVRIYFTDFVIQ